MSIREDLEKTEAVLLDRHFVYTGADHGTGYANLRLIAHNADLMSGIAAGLVMPFSGEAYDGLIGPETLGRTLVTYAPPYIRGASRRSMQHAIWCDISSGEEGQKVASFSEKMNFDRLIAGKRWLILEDLLTSGSTILATAALVRQHEGYVVGAAVAARRNQSIDENKLGIPRLFVLEDLEGFDQFTPEECAAIGPCSRQQPIVRRPGHGWRYEEEHPDYPGGFVDL